MDLTIVAVANCLCLLIYESENDVPGLMHCRTDVGGAYRWNVVDGSWIPLQDSLRPTNEE